MCDSSAAFLDCARLRTSEHAERIEYRLIDLTREEPLAALGTGEFDAAVCNMALMDIACITFERYAGARDPWLRAMILAPSLSRSMTAMVYGEPDFSELRALMSKPTSSVAMAFNDEPYPGITSDRFRGEAVVFPTTTIFAQRTAWLR